MKRLTSQKYYAMLLHAAQLLEAHSETINNMNVFPVPDGDTGSNMTMTIQGSFRSPSPRRCLWGTAPPKRPRPCSGLPGATPA